MTPERVRSTDSGVSGTALTTVPWLSRKSLVLMRVGIERLVELDDQVELPGMRQDRSHRRAGGRNLELGVDIIETRGEGAGVVVVRHRHR